MAANDRAASYPWINPSRPEGVREYLRTLRERWWIVVVVVVLTTAAAAAYGFLSPKVYESTASVLVSPVPEDSTALVSLGVLSRSNDPLRDIETAAALIANVDTAEAAEETLSEMGFELTPEEILESITVEPVANSDIISLTAESSDPDAAAAIANSVARGVIAVRSGELRGRLRERLAELEAAAEQADPTTVAGQALVEEVGTLQSLKGQPDPTLAVASPARPEESPVSPRTKLGLLGGVVAGLVLGIGAAFASRALDTRLRREEQLKEVFQLPILVRVPKDPAASSVHVPIAPNALAPPTREAYRALRSTLGIVTGGNLVNATEPGRAPARRILVTSGSAQEGKSTTALGLGAALAQAGRRVVLIEADLRRPELADTLRISGHRGVVSCIMGGTTVSEALMDTPAFGSSLRLLLADRQGPAATELFAMPAAEQVLEEASWLADVVIIDSAPMLEVVDNLPLARMVHDVVICAQLGRTRVPELVQLVELLAESGVRPSGFALLGTPMPRSDYYYYDDDNDRARGWAPVPGAPRMPSGSA